MATPPWPTTGAHSRKTTGNRWPGPRALLLSQRLSVCCWHGRRRKFPRLLAMLRAATCVLESNAAGYMHLPLQNDEVLVMRCTIPETLPKTPPRESFQRLPCEIPHERHLVVDATQGGRISMAWHADSPYHLCNSSACGSLARTSDQVGCQV